jgi:ribose transport system substrate-binding protein
MKRSTGSFYLALLAVVAALGSCQKAYHEENERYVFVAANIKLPYWQRAQAGFMDSAKVLKVKAEFTGPDRYDPDAELKAFQDAAASRPSGILVSPARPEIFKDAINAAVQAGVPVICVDSDSPASQRLLFIGTNNFRAGLESGEQIAELMHGRGAVVLITIPGQFNLDERARGVQEALKKNPSVHIGNIVNDSGVSQLAADNLSTLLLNKAAIDGILCLEASGGPGAAKALDNARMGGKIPLVAMDANPETLDWISKGAIAATVAQKPYSMSFYGLRMLDDLHHNVVHQFQDWRTAPTSPLPRIIDTGTAVINARNVEDFKDAMAMTAARQ